MQQRYSCQKGQGASADRLQVEAAKMLQRPIMDSPDPSKTQSTVGGHCNLCLYGTRLILYHVKGKMKAVWLKQQLQEECQAAVL